MVTESGTVRLIGFAIDARLRGDDLRNGNYPDVDDVTSDLFDLVGLLYAATRGEVARCVQLRRTGRSARRPRSAAAAPGACRRARGRWTRSATVCSRAPCPAGRRTSWQRC